MMRRLERKLLSYYDFMHNFAFYVRLSYPLRHAWRLARNTMSGRR